MLAAANTLTRSDYGARRRKQSLRLRSVAVRRRHRDSCLLWQLATAASGFGHRHRRHAELKKLAHTQDTTISSTTRDRPEPPHPNQAPDMPPRVKKNTGDTPSEDAMLAQLAAGSAPLQMPDLSSADAECAALFATFAEIVNNKLRTREDAERAARSHENARSIVDRAISALEQCALPAIVAGPEKEQELQSIMERWTRRRTMLMATRPTLPTLLDEGSENDRRVAVEKYRAAFHSAAAAVSAMRKRAVEASEVLRHYLEGVRDLGNAREEYDRCVRDQFRSDADAQKLAAAGEEVYRADDAGDPRRIDSGRRVLGI